MTELLTRLTAALADRYRILREVGAGGMATVYLAEDLRHGRQVALKVLRPELAATLGSERFFREIQVAARLQHPHILPLHDSGEAGGFLYYVMPFVEGESLRERLARSGELPIHDAVKILVEVVDALAYAHQQGVVHRDIKPDNVMLSGRHALVTDFGVAKAVSEATGRQQLTTAGVALGTPSYMAPEQAAADPNLDHRVDIYAVGAMAYELLTGRPPFTGMSSQQILAAHVTQAPEPLSRHRPSCPPALEAVVMRCLAKRAADRWQTADELLQQLEPLATPSGGMTPTQTRPITVETRVKRRASPVVFAAMALVAAAALFLAWGRGTPASVPLERIQLTSTGAAGTPAISADGKRVAYASRRCEEGGQCAYDIVAQDVDGGGVATVARGFASVWYIEWTADGRYLLIQASRGAAMWGVFSAPVLGGEPRFLGCCSGSLIGDGDTVFIGRQLVAGDSVGWVLRASRRDGTVYDSFPVQAPGAFGLAAWALAESEHVLVAAMRDPAVSMMVADARGHLLDTLNVNQAGVVMPAALRDRPGFLLWAPRPDRAGEFDLLRHRISRSGRIDQLPDTLLHQLPARYGAQVGRNGAPVYGSGPTEYTVRALTRAGASGLRHNARTLVRSTTFVGASLPGNGAWILLYRPTGSGGERTQFSLMPFDSGPETPLGPPVQLVDFDPAQDGRSMVLVTPLEPESLLVSRVEVPSGRSRRILALPAAEFLRLETGPGEGFVIQTAQASLRTIGIPGLRDTTLVLPQAIGVISALDPSPDGKAVVTLGWEPMGDSVVAHRVSLVDGSVQRLAAFGAEGLDPPRWFRDGTVLLPVHETSATMTWFRVPAAGGPITRLGAAPNYPADYRFALDGSRAVERQDDIRPDVFLIPNFGEVLKR